VEDRKTLATALTAGDLQYVASDHAPHDVPEKHGATIWQVRPGVIGVQHTLQLLWHMREELGLSLPDIARLTSFAPARAWGIWPRKGTIAPGADGDLVVVDPLRTWTIDDTTTYSRHRNSPYRGLRGVGAPVLTVVRGNLVVRDGSLVGRPTGTFVPGVCADSGGTGGSERYPSTRATSSPLSSRR
jgi:dihydroorotase-like cyclic amidohydrolase